MTEFSIFVLNNSHHSWWGAEWRACS